MALSDQIPDGSDVTFDTNCVIYYVEQNPKYLSVVEPLFSKIADRRLRAHVSAVTLIEVLVKPMREGQTLLALEHRALLARAAGVTIHEVDLRISERAASIRARWNLRVPDAIVAATALLSGCRYLVSNDRHFSRVAGLEALIIDDYV